MYYRNLRYVNLVFQPKVPYFKGNDFQNIYDIIKYAVCEYLSISGRVRASKGAHVSRAILTSALIQIPVDSYVLVALLRG